MKLTGFNNFEHVFCKSIQIIIFYAQHWISFGFFDLLISLTTKTQEINEKKLVWLIVSY